MAGILAGILPKFRRIVAKGFDGGDLHFLNLCEVGGHKKGLAACCCHISSITHEAFKQGEYGSCATDAYMSIWHETGASERAGVSLKPVRGSEVFNLASPRQQRMQSKRTET